MNAFRGFHLFLTFLLSTSYGFKLRIARFKVSSDKGAGMDGGFFGINVFGGGEFRMALIKAETREICETSGYLSTYNNDWERSEIDYFVGRSLQECEDFSMEGNVSLKLIHHGGNGGKLDDVEFFGSDFGYGENNREMYRCEVGVKLDGEEEKTFLCSRRDSKINSTSLHCHGEEKFCDLNFKNFTFLGTHNGGTGESSPCSKSFSCGFKNQDMNAREQLDFGVRFIDMDVISSTKLPNCHGLSTGHGKYPSIGFYYCFGLLKTLFEEVRDWLERTRNRDIVVLYFGAIDFESKTLPELKELLGKPDILGERLNSDFKTKKTWPTLGEAIESGKNVFVFVRSSMPLEEPFLVREIQRKSEFRPPVSEGEVLVTSTFKNRNPYDKCDSIVENAKELCPLDTDFIKLAAFAPALSKFKCLWTNARICNPRMKEAVKACSSVGTETKTVNFVQMDYPDFPGQNTNLTAPDVIYDINYAKV